MHVTIATLLAAGLLAGPAAAHVVLSPDTTRPGAYYAGVLRVSHGCGAGAATTALRVEIPAGVLMAKPQPKPGWTLAIDKEPLSAPIRTEGGAMQTQRARVVTWTGALPDDQFETFGLTVKVPAGSPGPLYFPTVQTCGAAQTRWTDIPAPGQAWHRVPHPAPVLNVGAASSAGAADPMAGMAHH